jgi:hypothetical protein
MTTENSPSFTVKVIGGVRCDVWLEQVHDFFDNQRLPVVLDSQYDPESQIAFRVEDSSATSFVARDCYVIAVPYDEATMRAGPMVIERRHPLDPKTVERSLGRGFYSANGLEIEPYREPIITAEGSKPRKALPEKTTYKPTHKVIGIWRQFG